MGLYALPRPVNNVYWFAIVNTLSWSIVQGLPLVLFFKALHAPATVLGLVVGLPPFFQVLQIPAAAWVERLGYRRYVVYGWSGRNVILLALVAAAFAVPWLSSVAAIALTCGIMVVYNILRGIGSAGFGPWFSQLFPAERRGEILAREKLAIQGAMIFNLVAVAWFLGAHPDGYVWLFLYAWIAGALALVFLRRIPDVPVPPATANATPVPWLTLIRHPPFARLLAGMCTYYLALGAAGVLWVPVLRDQFGLPDQAIASLPILSAGCNALTMIGLGPLLDQSGSRPVIVLAMTLVVVHLVIWASLAGGLIPYGLPVLLAIQVTAGVGMGSITLATERLLMASVPPQGRSHFFAISATVGGLTLGLGPILWGAVADLIGDRSWGPMNHHSLPYLLAAVIALVAGVLLIRVPEPQVLSTRALVGELVRLPVRALTRWRNREDLP